MKENYLKPILRQQGRSFTFVLLLSFACVSALSSEEVSLKEEHNFQDLGELMHHSSQPVVVAFVADYCGYCRQLEKDYLQPMVKSGEYETRILIRTVDIANTQDLVDFKGQSLSPSEFAKNYQTEITPTLVFLDNTGQEIAERLVGYSSPDYYGAYLESAIEQAIQVTHKANEPMNSAPFKDKGNAPSGTLPLK